MQKHAYTANLALNLGDTAKAAKELLTAESLARSATEKVLAYTNYINLYKAEGRFREALALTDSIIRRTEPRNSHCDEPVSSRRAARLFPRKSRKKRRSVLPG